MTVRNRSLRGSARRGFAVAAMSALVLASLPLSGTAFGAQENTEYLTGADTVAASIEWSEFTFDSAAAVAVGRDDVFADSLASGLIQGLGDGVPLLLTDSDTLDPTVSAEIERLGATTVHILGGETAISSGVEDALEADGLTIHRHAGASRVETAIDIASKHGAAATTAIVARAFASGADPTQAFADSLAAGGWAAEDDLPILLTQTNELHEAVEAYLASSDVDAVNIVGGTSAVSDAVKSSIEALGIDVTRVSGPTRFDTAIEIAKARGFASAADATDGVVVIEGQAADAWAAGFAAAAYAAGAGPSMGTQAIGVDGRPIVLVNGNAVPAATQAFLAQGGGINVVCFSNVTACDAASAAAGNGVLTEFVTTATDGPDLVSVAMGSGDDDDDERVVVFTFDEDVEKNAVSGGQFLLYKYNGESIAGGDTDESGNRVSVVFDYSEAEFATTGVVLPGAVQDDDGNENIEGSAPLQSVSLSSNETEGPDLTDIELDVDNAEATFVFDEDVDTDNAPANAFVLVLEDGTLIDDYDANTGVVIDDNEVTITYQGTDATAYDDEDEVVRGFIEPAAVTGVDPDEEIDSAPQSLRLEGDLEDNPRLLSASVSLMDDTDSDADPDTITYRFSSAIDVSDLELGNQFENAFFAVLADGTIFDGTQVAGLDDDQDDDTRVEVEFDDGLLDETVVRVGIYDDQVNNTDGLDNIGIQTVGVTPASFDAGETTGPDVVDVEVEADENAFGDIDAYELRITFDEDIDEDTIDAGQIVGYEADGDESDDFSLADSDCEVDSSNDAVLVCDIDDPDDVEDVVAIALQAAAIGDYDGNTNYETAFTFEAPAA